MRATIRGMNARWLALVPCVLALAACGGSSAGVDAGAAERAAAELFLAEQAVRAPARMVDFLMPGLGA